MQQKKYATCNAGKWKNVMSALLGEQKKNKSIKWIKIITEWKQTRNDKKINRFPEATPVRVLQTETEKKKSCSSINYEMPLGAVLNEFKSNSATKSHKQD